MNKLKKLFKTLDKREFGGILVDKWANCFCPDCVTVLNVEEINNPSAPGAHYLYEIVADFDYEESNWQFKCCRCHKKYPVAIGLKIKIVPHLEAKERSALQHKILEKFRGKQGAILSFGLLWG